MCLGNQARTYLYLILLDYKLDIKLLIITSDDLPNGSS